MATVEFRYDPKNTAWFTANAAMVLKAGEPAYHDTTGLFKLGDGVTALSALSFLPIVSSATPTIQQVLTAGQVATTTIETTGFVKTGGLSTQFLKADGTVDSTVYGVGDALTTNPLSQFAATTSSQLAGVISDETGSGALVFATSPTFTTNITTPLINGVSGTLTIADNISMGVKSITNTGGFFTSANSSVGGLYGNTNNLALSPKFTNGAVTIHSGFFAIEIAKFSGIRTSGSDINFLFSATTNTNQTATTNIPNFRINGANKQWATGTVANQYCNYLTANTASFVAASTMTNSFGLFVEAAIAGTNATITNNYAAGFSGNVKIISDGGSSFTIQGKVGSLTETAFYSSVTPSASNFFLSCTANSGTTILQAITEVALSQNGSQFLKVNSAGVLMQGNVTHNNAVNLIFGTGTGTKIGTATTQKLSFWNATPIVQPTTAVAAATVVSGTGSNVKHDDTFDGYTLEKIVKALRNIGLLA